MPTQRIARTALALGVLLAPVAVGGCSAAESGTPVAGGQPVTSERSTASGSPAEPPTASSEEPPPAERPASVDLTGIDVCEVLAALPLRDYRLDGDRPPLAGESSLFPGARDCFANGMRHNVSLLLVAVTDQGAQEFAEFATVATKSETVVAGYPLVVLTPQAPANCLGVLDVHEDQMLYLSYGLASPTRQPVTPQAELCAAIPAIATAAVAALG